jgi:hypothetical protein
MIHVLTRIPTGGGISVDLVGFESAASSGQFLKKDKKSEKKVFFYFYDNRLIPF